jgi:hypothetical protein
MKGDTVTVEIEVTPEPEPVADAPDVVVVDTGDSGGGGDIDTGILLGTLVEKVETLEAEIRELKLQQELAELSPAPAPDVEEVAEVVAEVVAEALAEEEEPEPVEPDKTPDKVHWAHRNRDELFGKGDN